MSALVPSGLSGVVVVAGLVLVALVAAAVIAAAVLSR